MENNYKLWQEFLSSLKQDLPLSLKRKFPENDNPEDIPEIPVRSNCLSCEFATQLNQDTPLVKRTFNSDGKTESRQKRLYFNPCNTGDKLPSNVDINPSTDEKNDGVISHTDAIRKYEDCQTRTAESEDSARHNSNFLDEERYSEHERSDITKQVKIPPDDMSRLKTHQSCIDAIRTQSSSPSSKLLLQSASSIPSKPFKKYSPSKKNVAKSLFASSCESPSSTGDSLSLGLAQSASKWDLEMFADYFDLKQHLSELLMKPETHEHSTSKTVSETHEHNISSVISDLYQDVTKRLLWQSNELKKETNIRVLLDGLLLRMCKLHDLYLQTEEEFKLPYLPTCRFDYLILNTHHKPIGCLEAKRPSSFDEKAFVQAVLEMCVLQQIAGHKNVNTEKTPVFCILSDGFRFVLMQLKGRQLLLEHSWPSVCHGICQSPKDVYGKLKIRVLENETDFTSLVSILSTLITTSNNP